MNESCIFCKIVKGEIPCSKVYEDEKFLAFLDIQPVSKGHTLLIPKAHYPWMHETPDELLAKTFITTKKLMNIIKDGLHCDYVQVTIVGKDVPHLHIHLMPRYFNDTLPMWPTFRYEDQKEKDEILEKIKSTL